MSEINENKMPSNFIQEIIDEDLKEKKYMEFYLDLLWYYVLKIDIQNWKMWI